MPREELEAFSSTLFDLWEARISEEIPLDDYALTLEIEEGSIKGTGKIRAVLFAVGLFVANYGSIVQGLQTMRSHVIVAGEYLTEKAHELLGPDKPAPAIRNRSGTLGQIQRLFLRVQRREITAEEAMAEAERILGAEASTAPDFMKRLDESFKEAPRQARQLYLSDEGELGFPNDEGPTQKPVNRGGTSQTTIPDRSHFRVEVWRESKRGKKRIRIIAI